MKFSDYLLKYRSKLNNLEETFIKNVFYADFGELGLDYIAEGTGYRPVNDLYLVYFEPPYKEAYEQITDGHTNGNGFEMPFKPTVHRIKKDTKEIDRLLEKASKIYELGKPPKGLDACKDCERLKGLINMVN